MEHILSVYRRLCLFHDGRAEVFQRVQDVNQVVPRILFFFLPSFLLPFSYWVSGDSGGPVTC